MSRHMIPVMLGLTILPIAAMMIAAYLLAFVGTSVAAVAGAILLLAVCVLVTAIATMIKLTRVEDWLFSQEEAMRDLRGKTERAATRVTDMERRFAQPAPGFDRLMSDVNALRQEVLEAVASRPVHAPAAPAPAPETAAAAAPGRVEEEHLDLLLEPVIELASGSTLHYRAQINLTNARGEVVGHADLMAKAGAGGMQAALDAHMVKLVAPVLRRLRLKNPGLRIFVPLGKATLGSRGEADHILTLLLKDADVANGMVFEFGQEDLGSLEPTGIENLARLGRLGATLALRDVYLGGLDLSALRQLGVRFLNFPPHAVDSGNGQSETWREFVQYARAMQIQLVVGDIRTPQQASAAAKSARFGHGPFFAPPRKVRRDAGVAAVAGNQASVA